VALLRLAVARGYRNLDPLNLDPDLVALRDRDDFIALLWDIAEAPAAP
jgi:hypothetical protein